MVVDEAAGCHTLKGYNKESQCSSPCCDQQRCQYTRQPPAPESAPHDNTINIRSSSPNDFTTNALVYTRSTNAIVASAKVTANTVMKLIWTEVVWWKSGVTPAGAGMTPTSVVDAIVVEVGGFSERGSERVHLS